MQKARSIFPNKTASYLAHITGYSQRAAEYWLAGKTRIPADGLAALLQSHWGREFLEAVMDQQRPPWWVTALAYFGAIDAARYQKAARRKLKAALYADRDITYQIARTEAAMLHSDPEFFEPHLAPNRAAARPQTGAVAVPSIKRRGR